MGYLVAVNVLGQGGSKIDGTGIKGPYRHTTNWEGPPGRGVVKVSSKNNASPAYGGIIARGNKRGVGHQVGDGLGKSHPT